MNKEILNAIIYFGSLAIGILKFVSDALENKPQA